MGSIYPVYAKLVFAPTGEWNDPELGFWRPDNRWPEERCSAWEKRLGADNHGQILLQRQKSASSYLSF